LQCQRHWNVVPVKKLVMRFNCFWASHVGSGVSDGVLTVCGVSTWCIVGESGRTDVHRGGESAHRVRGGCERSTNDRNFVF
jgi:hypothetical protein